MNDKVLKFPAIIDTPRTNAVAHRSIEPTIQGGMDRMLELSGLARELELDLTIALHQRDEWKSLYADLSNKWADVTNERADLRTRMGKAYLLAAATEGHGDGDNDNINEIERLMDLNPNPSGHSTTEASELNKGPEASGPVGLGPA